MTTYFPNCRIAADDCLIEVGIGTGHATKPFLDTGAYVTAVEYGENLADLCRRKFQDYQNFSVITSKFEDCEIPDYGADLVYSASAFHWIPEEIGYSRVYSILKPGGVFARFANHPFPDKGNPEMCEEIQNVYKAYAPFRGGKYAPPAEYTEENAKSRALIAENTALGIFSTKSITTRGHLPRTIISDYSEHTAII